MICLYFLAPLQAQKTAGIIQFEEKINMHRNLPEDAAEMKAMIPEFRVMKSELLFSTEASLYRNVEEEEDDDEAGNGQIQIKMQRPESVFFRDFAQNTKTDLREFMGKHYLIEGPIEQTPWKPGAETRNILGFTCMNAVWNDTAQQRVVTAWFAPDIAVSAGPISFGQLPGMILLVDINDGETVLEAKKIDFRTPKKGEMEAPQKGEKISAADFKKMVDERLKAMGGGRGLRVIRH